jgi:tRNA G18 (ribose-2'-O)-methylase SpoU
MVTDPADPRLADYVGLRDAELRRPDRGWFIAEGRLVIEQLVRSAYPVRSVLLTPARRAAAARLLASVEAPIYLAEPGVLNAVAGFDLHRGMLASADRLPLPSVASVLAGAREAAGAREVAGARVLTRARVVAVVEGVNDHENLGSLFRNAAAFGVGAVVLDPTCCDPLYRRSVRVSMGHVLRVPFARASDWPGELGRMRSDGWRLVALTPLPTAEPLERLRADERPVALILGAEGPGLSAGALALAEERVRIPLAEGVDSLNVATAAALAFHHLRP